MDIKIIGLKSVLILACAILLGINPLQAAEEGGFSVGHDLLSKSKDDPKDDSKGKMVGSITAKYGFGASKELKPYIGTGLAYSYSEPSKPGEAVPGLKAGVAGQAGINFLLRDNVSLSVDYKFLNLQPDAKPGANDPSTQKLGIGLDIKF
jgi:outer membrane protein W